MRITNAGTVPLYLVSPLHNSHERIVISDSDGRWWPGNRCTSVCDGIMLGGCGCTLIDIVLDPVALMPGGTYELEWPGMVWEEAQMPEACGLGECAGHVECRRAIAPPGGPSSVTLAYSLDCEGYACGCAPNDDGWCVAEIRLPAESVIEAELAIDDPFSCGPIELTLP